MGDDRRTQRDDRLLADRASATSGEKSIRSAALIASLSSQGAAIGRRGFIGNLQFRIMAPAKEKAARGACLRSGRFRLPSR